MKRILVLLIPSLFLIIGCKDSANPVSLTPNNGGGKISTGEVVNLTTQSIGTGGGTIKVSKPGDPLDGLEISIPADAFNSTNLFNISYAEIKSHEYGQYFNPITSLIKITHDGDYSDLPILVKIPIKLPQGKFAMGFLYNHKTGEIEGIPISDLDSNYIIVASRHFTSRSSLQKKINISNDILGDLVVGTIDESVLNNQTLIQTGFDPGEDDWEYINYGSYLEPGGICAGQTLTEMWYYLEKTKKGAGQTLFHRYDQINNKLKPNLLWQDNPKGYRFASVIQADINWDTTSTQRKLQISKPSLTWKVFALSMLLTSEPQFVAIFNKYTGHALTAYKMDYPSGKLYVADPNYPGNIDKESGGIITREIVFQNGKFEPFYASLNANSKPDVFDSVYYYGKTTMIDWPKLSSRWTEFEAGTIGNDKFPSYKLYVESTSGLELTDGMIVTKPALKIVCKSDKCESIIANTDKLQPIIIFNQSGDSIAASIYNQGVATVNLNQGANKIGIYIQGLKAGLGESYVDFKWVTVNYNQSSQPQLFITPNPLYGLKNKKYKFVATLEGAALPAKPKYFWGMDAHGTTITIYNSDTLEYKYKDTGTFPIQVSLYDSVTGIPIAYGSSQAKIREAANNFEYLITSWLLYFSFYADMKFNPANAVAGELKISTDYYFRGHKDLTWDGNYFSVDYKYGVPPISTSGDTLFVTGSFIGRISSDGSLITSFTATEHQQSANGYVRDQSIDIAGVQINNCSPNGCSAIHEGSQVKGYITNISISGSYKDSGQTINYSLVSVDYNSSNKPKLSISFVR